MNPRQGVRPGQRLEIAAAQINFLNQLMAANGLPQAGGLPGWAFGNTVVLVKNTTGSDVPRWGVLAITGVEINPNGSDRQRIEFESMPCLTGTAPTSTTTEKFVVTVDPIKNGTVGRAVLAGVTQAKLTGGDANSTKAKPAAGDTFALAAGEDGAASILWRDGDWGLVRFGGGGDPVRLCKTTAAWPRNTKATLHVWESGTPPDEEITTVPVSEEYPDGILTLDAYNKSYDVAACVWVLVGKGKNGKWYLLEAAVPDPTESGACYAPNIGGHDLTTVAGYASNKKQALTHDENACLKWVDIEECSS